jgi:hypothetical protein
VVSALLYASTIFPPPCSDDGDAAGEVSGRWSMAVADAAGWCIVSFSAQL